MKSDGGADPGLVLIEIHPHHLPFTEADEIVDQHRGIVPEEHHADLGCFVYHLTYCSCMAPRGEMGGGCVSGKDEKFV